MTKDARAISQQDVVTTARISHIELYEQEVNPLVHEIEQILVYARRVKKVPTTDERLDTKNRNVFRADESRPCDAAPLLRAAPISEGSYFVVPVIIEHR